MTTNIAPEQLTRENYRKWRVCMKNYLIANDLWDIIVSEPPNQEEAEAEFKAWKKKNAAALYVLQASCSLELFYLIEDLDSAKVCWHTLAQKFQEAEEAARKFQEEQARKFQEEEEARKFQELVRKFQEEEARKFQEEQARKFQEEEQARKFQEEEQARKFQEEAAARKFQEEEARKFQAAAALHFAVDANKVDVVEEILKSMSEEDFELTDGSNNPFILASGKGSFKIVDLLFTRCKKFVEISSADGMLPVAYACLSGHRELTWFLYLRTPFQLLLSSTASVQVLLVYSISNRILDLALDLLNRMPNGESGGICKEENLLLTLSLVQGIFPSHVHFSSWKRWIYSGIRVKLSPVHHPMDDRIPLEQEGQMNSSNLIQGTGAKLPHASPHPVDIGIQMEQEGQMNSSNLIQELRKLQILTVFVRLWRSLRASVQQISGYKQLFNLKLTHCQAVELLRLLFQNIPRRQCIELKWVQIALFRAAELGILEIVVAALKHNPDLSSITNDEGRTVFQQAIQFRQGKIFSLVYTISEKLNFITFNHCDNKGSNALNIAGMLASQSILAKISSPALQMQSELKWFKEVASAHPSKYPEKDFLIEMESKQFAESHKEMKGKGEEWYKGIATSSTVVGALIITIMFTVAFTVPGGNNSTTGLPIFSQEKAFKVYIVADAISLFASSTSVLTFLGILTARYEEDDFLVSLPRKLIIALSSLFFSIAAMMICFCATVVIMLHGDLKLIIPIVLLACSPLAAFISLQFPLLKDVFNSTYRYDIFDRKMKLE